MSKKYWYIMMFFTFLFFSCASPLVKKMQSGDVRYEGVVTPVTIPISPEYKPGKFRTNMSVALLFAGETEEGSRESITTISKMGDLLLSETSFDEIVIRMLTDKYGHIKEIEAISGSKKYDEYLKAEVKKTIRPLPNKPIRTGDEFIRLDLQEILGSIGYFITDSDDRKYSVNTVLKGWSYYNGKKVIVTEADQVRDFSITDFLKISIKLKGYSLLDPENFQVIKGEIVMDINDPSKGSIKFYMHAATSEIK